MQIETVGIAVMIVLALLVGGSAATYDAPEATNGYHTSPPDLAPATSPPIDVNDRDASADALETSPPALETSPPAADTGVTSPTQRPVQSYVRDHGWLY
ncbi:hypothetical protein [Halorussus halophilus]|uniref:hypothetical protein n=1 Tax=Halorussus halophilus TaxID=2650975 RepID=UPI00130191F3|nr:hypothetical protein [Halorussus halophilus]